MKATRASKAIGCTKERTGSLQVRFRILVSLVQVLNSLGVVFSITYPPLYDSLVAYLNVFSLDLFAVMPLGCSFEGINHDHYLLLRTLIPIILLAISFSFRRCLKRRAEHKRKDGKDGEAKVDDALADQILSYNFVLVYLLFPSTSSAIFSTFQCDQLDNPAQSSRLLVDLSVDCSSTFHQVMMAYAGLMVLVYPLGVPALYAYLLFYRHGAELRVLKSLEKEQVIENERIKAAQDSRAALKVEALQKRSVSEALRRATTITTERVTARSSRRTSRRAPQVLESGGDLIELQNTAEAEAKIKSLKAKEEKRRAKLPDYVQKLIMGYELRTYYFEIVECARKLAIVCVPVFLPPGSSSQLIFGLMVCFLTFGVHITYNPYIADADDRLAQLCQVQIFFALLASVALKYDTATIDNPNSMDTTLCILTFLPMIMAIYLESPLPEMVSARLNGATSAARRATRRLTATIQKQPLGRDLAGPALESSAAD